MQLTFVIWDHLLLIGLGSAVLLWWWQFPRMKRADAAGVAGVRLRYYAVEIVPLWLLSAGVIALWIALRRPWSGLLLGGSAPWRVALGWALAVAYVWLSLSQRRLFLARPERLVRIMKSFQSLAPILPRTPGERRGFAALSITAGICEELMFRGFVLWYATAVAGPVVGFLVSSAFFGVMHLYLGAKEIPRTAMAGIFFYIVAVTAGSLLPAMVCHVVADLVSGDLGYRALTAEAMPASASA